MVKNIIRDVVFLAQKSEPATEEDKQVVIDLLDTLRANLSGCVGMAANMIGVNKQIIAISLGMVQIPMINPKITKKLRPYEAEEMCLSLSGVRKTTRYEEIEVEYLDENFNRKKGKYVGFVAQIIQHETDHLNGIVI